MFSQKDGSTSPKTMQLDLLTPQCLVVSTIRHAPTCNMKMPKILDPTTRGFQVLDTNQEEEGGKEN